MIDIRMYLWDFGCEPEHKLAPIYKEYVLCKKSNGKVFWDYQGYTENPTMGIPTLGPDFILNTYNLFPMLSYKYPLLSNILNTTLGVVTFIPLVLLIPILYVGVCFYEAAREISYKITKLKNYLCRNNSE